MSEQSRRVLKTILHLTSQLLWVLGLGVGLSGVYLLLNYRQNCLFFSHGYITLPAVLALTSGVVLVTGGALGLWLSLSDSTFLKGLFVYLLLVVFCLESTASVLAGLHSSQLDSEIAPIHGVFQEYTGSSQDPVSQAVDATQRELQCCGVHDYRDWRETPWFNLTGGHRFPHSCCNSTFTSCNSTVEQPWQLYSQGCMVKLEMSFKFMLSFVIWGFPLVFLVEVVLFLTMIQLMRDEPLMEYQSMSNRAKTDDTDG